MSTAPERLGPVGVEGAAGEARGFVAPGFEPVAEEFGRCIRERGDTGAAFAALVDGAPVVDLYGGLADRRAGRRWDAETIVGIFSGSKGLVATCLLILLERGLLDLDAPVWAYWPEFRAEGKEGILVRHLVSHQAGLPGLTTPVSVQEVTDPVRMASLLARQPAIAPPGAPLYYHALTFGWLCGELVRRVDGRGLGTFLREEVAGPLGLDAWIGLPRAEEDRVAVLERGGGFGAQARDISASRELDPLAWSIWANPPRFTTEPLIANTRLWHGAEIPASSGIASARSMARLYGCLALGGELEGARVLSPGTIRQGTTCLAAGIDPFLCEPMRFGVGFQLQTGVGRLGPEQDAFGHPGAGGSVHGAWPRLGTGFSYAMNTLREGEAPDPRSDALLRSLHAVVDSGGTQLR